MTELDHNFSFPHSYLIFCNCSIPHSLYYVLPEWWSSSSKSCRPVLTCSCHATKAQYYEDYQVQMVVCSLMVLDNQVNCHRPVLTCIYVMSQTYNVRRFMFSYVHSWTNLNFSYLVIETFPSKSIYVMLKVEAVPMCCWRLFSHFSTWVYQETIASVT